MLHAMCRVRKWFSESTFSCCAHSRVFMITAPKMPPSSDPLPRYKASGYPRGRSSSLAAITLIALLASTMVSAMPGNPGYGTTTAPGKGGDNGGDKGGETSCYTKYITETSVGKTPVVGTSTKTIPTVITKVVTVPYTTVVTVPYPTTYYETVPVVKTVYETKTLTKTVNKESTSVGEKPVTKTETSYSTSLCPTTTYSQFTTSTVKSEATCTTKGGYGGGY
ncbi:uncharacterized protein K452DRAFT_116724 [Aplosporella prunicola CBS 121167]|uniref:Uncharacterized protein n=1 Tax=Aplosporella prunicola CBS 121167 TaxID=1176127 RepID=A0A6A6B022_9PEZI|nr:uncharacterized protein K452DRAFT_116724 [Aplosporella prunicola CBS 121167]KAF2136888.1 hypothetical protein K452DRAFT_116724 [Aplosporella prunicola CBS 121167]